MINVDRVINVAKGEVGYVEKASNSQLEDKTANAGSKNYTKYGQAQGCNGQPWCDAFVDWCFIQAYSIETAKRLICGFSNYTPTSASYFKSKGLYASCRPQRGDIIFFRNSQRICHTGIVTRVFNGRVYTIEGNSSSENTLVPNGGAVVEKNYPLTYKSIAGYGRPNYLETETPTLYKGCQGVAVKKMQTLLNEKFPYNKISCDGDFGNLTSIKLCEAQSMMGIEHDSICGKQTWAKLLN